jgi:hypothetical protein
MRNAVIVFTLAVFSCSLVGCGGPSARDMKYYAKRKSAPEVDQPGEKKAVEVAQKNAKAEKAPAAAQSPPAPPPVPAKPPSIQPGEAPAGPPISNAKPDQPLLEIERRARSIANLEKIGRALAAYVAKRGTLPPQALTVDGDPYVSWRVIILPELGYPELRARFRPDEPWDGPRNKQLLDYIPPEYQSPERFDGKTNYLGVTGRGMAIASPEGMAVPVIKDGLENTLAVVEVDDQFAQPWTCPADFVPVLNGPNDKFGTLRGNGTFAVLASGRAVLLPAGLDSSHLAAFFTPAGGEPVGGANFMRPSIAVPPPNTAKKSAEVATAPTQPPAGAVVVQTKAPAAKRFWRGITTFTPDADKDPVPDEQSLAKARELLKELYGKEYDQARAQQERQQLLKKLLLEITKVEESPADFYELGRITRDLAVGLGDVTAALSACRLLEERFQVDPAAMRLQVLEDLAKQPRLIESVDVALKEARRLARESFESDRYELALPAQELTLKLARIKAAPKPWANSTATNKSINVYGKGTSQKVGTPESPQEKAMKAELVQLQDQQEMLEAAKLLFHAAQRASSVLETDPSDAKANEAVGRYLCFVKNNWDVGLPYLSQAADIRLRGIASLETAAERGPSETLSLADQCWDLADRFKQPQRRGLQLRAAYCYEMASAGLASGLEKIRAQKRIDEAAAIYGREEIDRVLAPLRTRNASAKAE